MAKTCFIISVIGEEGSPERKTADDKYEIVFAPVLQEAGYEPIRADKAGMPGSISYDIIRRLVESDLVIADISIENPNVFYELAIRNAAKKPVIVFRRDDQKMPFDIYDSRAITIDMQDPRIWPQAKNELQQQIAEVEKDPKLASKSILSEFSFAIESQEKVTPGTEINLMMKDIMYELKNIRSDVNELKSNNQSLIPTARRPSFLIPQRGLSIRPIPLRVTDGDFVSLFIDFQLANVGRGQSTLIKISIRAPDGKTVLDTELPIPSSPVTAQLCKVENWKIEGPYTITATTITGQRDAQIIFYTKKKE